MSDYPEVGKEFPDFELMDQNENIVKLSSFRGKNVILYFYPKDNTKGCSSEACDFRDRLDFFEKENCIVLGVSPDNLKSHQRFSSKYDLNFPLLIDEEHKFAELVATWSLKKNYGREYYGIVRTTFVIDSDGILRQIYKKVRVKEHVEKVLEYVRENLNN